MRVQEQRSEFYSLTIPRPTGNIEKGEYRVAESARVQWVQKPVKREYISPSVEVRKRQPRFRNYFVIKWTSVKQTYTRGGGKVSVGKRLLRGPMFARRGLRRGTLNARPLVMHVLRGSANFRWNLANRYRFWLHCYKVNWWFVALATDPTLNYLCDIGRSGEAAGSTTG